MLIIGTEHRSLAGNRYGRLTAVERVSDRITKSGRKLIAYKCICDCGNETIVDARHLTDGSTKSCGCFKREKQKVTGRMSGQKTFTHRMSNTRIYRIWGNLVNRCTNKNNPAYKNYGGRGITVCKEWKNSFELFYKWAIESGYSDGLTIDRIDNDAGYCPENCRWVDRTEQGNNKRNNVYYTYKGKNVTLAQLSHEFGIPYKTLHRRVHSLGWDLKRAVEEPLHKQDN